MPPVTLKVVPRAVCDTENCSESYGHAMNEHLRKFYL
jgi:hypothetical protein